MADPNAGGRGTVRATRARGAVTGRPAARRRRLDALPEVRFDGRRARTYAPLATPKRARIVRARTAERTTILAQWGQEQHFVGTWVAVLDDAGNVIYGSAYAEWLEMHERVPGTRNTWRKTATVDAYQHRGAPGRVTTVLTDGTRETINVVRPGDWLVRQRHGEVQVIPDDDFRRRYDAEHPRRRSASSTR